MSSRWLNVEVPRKAASDLAWSAVSTAFEGLCGLVLMLLVGNALPESELGGYSLAVSLYLLVSMLAPIGSQVATVVYGARAGDDRVAFGRMATASLTLAIVMGVVVGGALAAAAPQASTLLAAPTLSATLPRMALGFPWHLVNKVLLALLNSRRRLRALALGTVARGSALMALTWLTLRAGWGLNGAALVFSVAEILVAAGMAWCLRSSFDIDFRELGVWARRLLTLGSGSMAATLVSQLNARVDLLLVSSLLGSQGRVGAYAVATMMASAPIMGLAAFQRVSTPMLSAYWSRGAADLVRDLTHRMGRTAVLLTAGYACALSLLYPQVVGLLYRDRPLLVSAESAAAAALLLLGHVIHSYTVPCAGLFVSAERPHVGALATLIGLLVNVTLNVWLVPGWSLPGAAVAASAGRIIMTAVVFHLARGKLGLRLWNWKLLPLWACGWGLVMLGFLPLPTAWRLLSVAAAWLVLGVWGLWLGDFRARLQPTVEAESRP